MTYLGFLDGTIHCLEAAFAKHGEAVKNFLETGRDHIPEGAEYLRMRFDAMSVEAANACSNAWIERVAFTNCMFGSIKGVLRDYHGFSELTNFNELMPKLANEVKSCYFNSVFVPNIAVAVTITFVGASIIYSCCCRSKEKTE